MVRLLMEVSAGAALIGATVAHAAVNAQSQLFGRTIRGTASPKQLALTFDDGPNPAITPQLLDLLDRHGAKASFFVIGRFVRECPAMVQEISARGHLIGNHTQTHPNLFWLGPTGLRGELQQCQQAIEDTTGSRAKYFRPPFGFRNPWVVSTARELGMATVMWTLLPGDWLDRPLEWLNRRIQPIEDRARADSYKSGDVLCLHDGAHRQLNADRTRTLATLEYWIPRWRDAGLKFVTIAEAVSTPAN
jgi:peptidoglycan/xylan/chitin deacetylase (PgdA/CDA1 family)